jgi:hypothetical protein
MSRDIDRKMAGNRISKQSLPAKAAGRASTPCEFGVEGTPNTPRSWAMFIWAHARCGNRDRASRRLLHSSVATSIRNVAATMRQNLRRVFISEQKHYVFGTIKCEPRRRSAIEVVIGQHEDRWSPQATPPVTAVGHDRTPQFRMRRSTFVLHSLLWPSIG